MNTAVARGHRTPEPVWDELYPAEQARILRLLAKRIDVAPDGISVSLHAAGIRRAHRWRRKIDSGRAKSISDLGEQEGVTDAYVYRLLRSPVSRRISSRQSWTGGSRRG